MSTTQQCFSSTLHPNWTSYSPTNIPNAIIISKLILFYGFITKSVLKKDQVINDLTQVVSIDKYKQHASVFFSTIPENLNDINIVSTHVNNSFNDCVNNIKQQNTKNHFPIINLLEILSEFRDAMTNTMTSYQYFSELKSLSEIFLPRNNNPFHSISNINDIQKILDNLYKPSLKIYLSLCPGADINLLTIQSILFGSLFLAKEMKPLIDDKSKSPPKRRWLPFGGKKSRRHRKRKRQRNRISRQNK